MKNDSYLVLGNPIAHSKSPLIHRAFAEQSQQDIDYDKRLVPLDSFAECIRQLQSEGIKGANVTVPFKEAAFQIVDELSNAAQLAGAVNTLSFQDDGRIAGDNTDGIGLLRDLTKNHKLSIKGKRILILGAGGAVRGILKPLIEQRPSQVMIVNRTLSKAEELVTLFAGLFDLSSGSFESLVGRKFDLMINATSLGLQGKVAPVPDGVFADNAVAYDLMYGDGSKAFQQWAGQQGAKQAYDGLGMLVQQAAASFSIWRGVQPETQAVIDYLRSL